MKEIIYGFCRTSTYRQNIERQIRNIIDIYPTAIIVKEVYTGTKLEGRKEFNKLINQVKEDIRKGNKPLIVFDSVSRMSRNEEEGFNLYQELFNLGVELVFIKEPHINTETYSKTLKNNIPLTNTNADIILEAVKQYLMEVAKEQIKLAFQQAEKEVIDLHRRTSEGILTAKLKGKQIGRIKGKKYISKKEEKCKEIILKNSRNFNGNNTDEEVMKICGISRNSYYKYKDILKRNY